MFIITFFVVPFFQKEFYNQLQRSGLFPDGMLQNFICLLHNSHIRKELNYLSDNISSLPDGRQASNTIEIYNFNEMKIQIYREDNQK
jgi:hypothetical protein